MLVGGQDDAAIEGQPSVAACVGKARLNAARRADTLHCVLLVQASRGERT